MKKGKSHHANSGLIGNHFVDVEGTKAVPAVHCNGKVTPKCTDF